MNKIDGHEVEIIASTETYVDNVTLGYVKPSCYVNKDNIRVNRLAYKKYINRFISTKIRRYNGLLGTIERFDPDIIFLHGLQMLALKDIVAYKHKHPEVKIYADSHEDYVNSATNLFSKYFLHKLIYKPVIQKNLSYIEKIFYVGYDAVPFLKEMYGIPDDKLEFLPLGGIIISEEEQKKQREKLMKEYELPKNAIICAHSGKMVKEKKTEELLRAFSQIHDDRLRIFIFGSIPENRKEIIEPLIKNDDRIYFLGWKNNKEILDILAGTDLYCQPGTMSATYQNALCAGCATMIRPTASYKHMAGDIAIYTDGTEENITSIFTQIVESQDFLLDLKEKSYKLAKEKLDYQKLSRRYLN